MKKIIISLIFMITLTGIIFLFSKEELIDYSLESFLSTESDFKTEEARRDPIFLGSIADGVYRFLLNKFEKDKELFLSRNCLHNRCELSEPAALPGRAWNLLAHARALDNLEHENERFSEEEQELIRKNAKDILYRWIEQANLNNEVYSTHQLFSAYQVYGNEVALRWFYSRVPFVMDYAKRNIIPTGKLFTLEPYLLTALARQLANGALISLDRELLSVIYSNEEKQNLKISEAEEFIRISEILINSVKRTKNTAVLEEYHLVDDYIPGSSKNTKISQFACFESWANASLLEAYMKHPSAKYQKKSRKLKRELISFIKTMGEFEKAGNNLLFSTMQSVLSCVHTISDLKKGMKDFPPELDLRSSLVLKYVLPQLDLSTDNTCQADGGLFSTFELKDEVGCQRDKSLVDNSWFYFLIDSDLQKIEVGSLS